MQIDFHKKENGLELVINLIKDAVFRKISKSSLPLFVRGRDILSVSPQTSGAHEPDLTNLINWFAENGYSDFLIDIGANIGLTSCQNGKSFKSVFCFEPNPLCSSVLKVNAEIALDTSNVSIFDFGLGSTDQTLELMIPKNNWGGAFVVGSDNEYSEDVLASKDGFNKIEKKNYLTKKVKIKSAKTELSKIFKQFSGSDIVRGVIKIDVEGMETVVLKGIAESLPKNVRALIVFENWDPNFDFSEVLKVFLNRKVKLQKLVLKMPKKTWPKGIRQLLLLFYGKTLRVMELSNCKNKTGDIILQID